MVLAIQLARRPFSLYIFKYLLQGQQLNRNYHQRLLIIEVMSGNPQPDSQKESQACHHSRETPHHATSSASLLKGEINTFLGVAQHTCRESSANLSTSLERSHQVTITVSGSHCGARLEQCPGCIWNLRVLLSLECDVAQNRTLAPLWLHYLPQAEG